MGNTHTTNSVQNGAIDSNVSIKIKGSRKNNNVKERVLARFTSKKSLLKDVNFAKCENLCENEQQNENLHACQQTVSEKEKRNGTFEQTAVVETTDIKRFSQISQSADSAKDALDCGELLYFHTFENLLEKLFVIIFKFFFCVFEI